MFLNVFKRVWYGYSRDFAPLLLPYLPLRKCIRRLKRQANMKIAKLIKDYSKLSEANLDFKAQMVVINLTDNPNFPVTEPSIANFTLIKNAYTAALQNSADGGRTAVAIKNQAKEDLLTNMRNLALNIEAQAQGDKAKLVSSGFDLAADGENVQPLASPSNFQIADGLNAGELKLSVKAVAQAVSYLHEYTEGPVTEDSKWISKVSTSREHTFSGIRSGIRVYGRVAVIGRKGQEVYSNVLTRVVQ